MTCLVVYFLIGSFLQVTQIDGWGTQSTLTIRKTISSPESLLSSNYFFRRKFPGFRSFDSSRVYRLILHSNQPEKHDKDDVDKNNKCNDLDIDDSIDRFLDTPFYNPDTVLNDPKSSQLERKFANFIKNDYYTAEALLAGLFFVILVIATQEILRIQLFGFENYVPFSKGTPFGRLF
jgi:hypothetical protein